MGSVLIAVLSADYAEVTAQTKVRALFGIEALVRAKPKYQQYFEHNWLSVQSVAALVEPD